MTSTQVTYIQEADLPEVGQFLHENLNSRFSATTWIQSLRHEWSAVRPNFGAQLRDGTRLVGVLCAVYSDQTINGKTEKFCNPHSWCVLSEYRNQGINLVLQVVKQAGFHYTMMTPNPKVAQVFRGLRFKDLGDATLAFPNLPSWRGLGSKTFCESDHDKIAARLTGSAARDFALHRSIPWLRFVAFGTAEAQCLVVYKTSRWKRLPAARIIHISDRQVFHRYLGLLTHHLLMHKGLFTSQVEARFTSSPPKLVYRFKRTQGKLFLSKTLQDWQIPDLYSELAALDV